MKKHLMNVAAVALLATTVLMTSCKKEETDSTAPVITLNGAETIYVNLNGTYSELDATAKDEKDGTVTVTKSGTVTVATEGTYTITYTAKDAAGNTATKTRKVVVIDIVGTYAVSDVAPYPGGTTTTYNETTTLSTTSNGKVNVTRFGNYDNGGAYFNLSSSTTLTVPSQDVTCGNPSALRNFTGSGTISKVGGVTVLTIDYTEVTNGTTIKARGVYTKQ